MGGWTRREWLGTSLAAALSVPQLGWGAEVVRGDGYVVKRLVAGRYFNGSMCYVHARAGVLPRKDEGGNKGEDLIVMTLSSLDLVGSDVFRGFYEMKSVDGGRNWTKPALVEQMGVREEVLSGVQVPVAASDFWPKYHGKSGKLLGIGHSVVYTPEWKVMPDRPRHTVYSIFDEESGWTEWKKLELPLGDRFCNAGAGCVQRHDCEDGSILLPIYFKPRGENSRVVVLRVELEGNELVYRAHGNELWVEDKTRGLHEPSLAKVGESYFLTIRNDQRAYVTRSEDGLNYQELREWKFDDGSDLGCYNTQQHWVVKGDRLFLVYTRRGAGNDHVFRHRAPLFMAEVHQETLRVLRSSERILVPERGARLGNFGVTEVSERETWVTAAEWMQPRGVEKYGSDGSIWIARILWEKDS